MKNNNKKVVSFLAPKEYRADRGKQLVLTGAVAFAVMMLFCVFSFALGKLETDMLRNARERGAVSDTALERATQEQYEEIKELPYIKDVGRYIQFGYALGDRAAVIDDVAWEKIKSPAYTDIHGNYPMEKMDVMLPIRTLERSCRLWLSFLRSARKNLRSGCAGIIRSISPQLSMGCQTHIFHRHFWRLFLKRRSGN